MNMFDNKDVTIDDVINQSVTASNYSTWTEYQLMSEISHRRLCHGVSIGSFPDEQARMSRLVEILEGNDRLRLELKVIAERRAK